MYKQNLKLNSFNAVSGNDRFLFFFLYRGVDILNFLKKGHFVTYVHEFQLYNALAKELKGQWIVLPWKKTLFFSLFLSLKVMLG